MRSYFKSIVKDVYDNVVHDQYLDSLTQGQLYKIVSRTQNSSHSPNSYQSNSKTRRLSFGGLEEGTTQKIQNLSIITPERQFRILGYDPSFSKINSRTKQLQEISEQLGEVMMENFPKFTHMMTKSISEIDQLQSTSLYSSRKKTLQLRKRLLKLEQASQKSQKITQLQIKMKNIKNVVAVLKDIPNIRKMSLIQLKTVAMKRVQNNQKMKMLNCLRGLQQYIERVVASELSGVVKIIQECLVHKFDANLYENALKKFMIAQHQTIKYERLLIKLVQKQLRRYAVELGGQIFQISQFYIKIMINLHSVFRWHRQNQQQQSWKIRKWSQQQLAEQNAETDIDFGQNNKNGQFTLQDTRSRTNSFNFASISVHIPKVTKNIAETIDECLKDSLLQKLHNPQTPNIYLQIVYLILRISTIVDHFSGYRLLQSIQTLIHIKQKSIKKLKQKGFHQLKQGLNFQNQNDWNRLPVASNYSHTIIDKAMYQISAHSQFEQYNRVLKLINKFNKKVQIKQRQYVMSTQKIQTEQEQQEQQQSWEVQQISFGFAQKFQKNIDQIRLNCTSQVIICQSSLMALKYIQKIIQVDFYLPDISLPLSLKNKNNKNQKQNAKSSEQSSGLQNCTYLLQFYIFYIFQSLLTSQLRSLFFIQYQSINTLDGKYHKNRVAYQYSMLYKFIKAINHKYKWNISTVGKQRQQSEILLHSALNGNSNNHNSSNGFNGGNVYTNGNKDMEKLGLVKCRVVACQSASYICQYIQHMMKLSKINKNSRVPLRIKTLKQVINQLSQLTYTDVIPKLINIKTTMNLVDSIKWHEDTQEHINQYCQTLVKNYKQFYYKVKSFSKGQVPKSVGDQIFGLFWKTQLTTILKIFMKNSKNQKGIRTATLKIKLQTFIDRMYTAIIPLIQGSQNLKSDSQQHIWIPYSKTKNLFPILLEQDWQKCSIQIKQTLQKFEYVYSIEMGLVQISECSLKISNYEQQILEKRKKQLQKYIEKLIFNSEKKQQNLQELSNQC